MPRGDGTGPFGLGPMTGRALGYCAGYNMPGFMNPMGFGRGFRGGFGFGRGFGGFWRRGFGFRRMFALRALAAPQTPQTQFQPTKEEELKILEDEAKAIQQEQQELKRELEEIKKRISQLKGKKEKD